MKLRLLDHLRCPIDGSPLDLVTWEAKQNTLPDAAIRRIREAGLRPEPFATEVVTGVLLNRSKKIIYPIHGGIPRLLVFPTSVAQEFARRHAERIARELPSFSFPSQNAMPGEQTVLRTFSTEWVNYEWNEEAYWSSKADVVFQSMDFLLDLKRKPVKDKLVLEVGIGIGGIADHVVRNHGCELVGMDLGYAVDAAYKNFGRNPFLHIVQASAFRPPFAESTFDLVYSQGVIHHTFSTETAFRQICRLPKPAGRLYIWVYDPDVERRTVSRRAIMLMETVLRPVCCRLPAGMQTAMLLPIVPLYVLQQGMRVKQSGDSYVKYGWREAIHAARDKFTPRYAHRHTEAEVCRWFQEAGYRDVQHVDAGRRPPSVPVEFVLATAVDGIRS
jgi:SAM-dependent methyltransferase/uncharacterized protein YbaR (Trm112 family)